MYKSIENIHILGTSHVSKKSVDEIKKKIEELNPEVVGIELDYQRLQSLLSKRKLKPKLKEIIREFGVFGGIFLFISSKIQQNIGKKLGILPGEDMKSAFLYAREKKIPIALIDQNIKKTIKNISNLSFYKKIKIVFSIFFKSFNKKYNQKINATFKNGDVPTEKTIIEIIEILKKEVPDFYNIIINDRDVFMSKKALKLKEKHNGPILLVVGAGHVKGMEEYIRKNMKKEVLSFNFKFNAE